MDRDLMHSRSFQVAGGALAVGVVLTVWALMRAVQIEPVAEAAPPVFATAAATALSEPRGAFSVTEVVALDLFAPERTAPARRYRLSGYTPEAPRVEPPQPIVLGTSVENESRSFAICRVAGGAATVVRIGGKIGGFTVVSIERSTVVFTSPSGERVTIKAPTP